MKRYAAERILWAAIGVFIATVFVFAAFRVVTRQSDLSSDSRLPSRAARRVAAYYDGPVHERYGRFIWQLAGRRSLGESFYDGFRVNRQVWGASLVTGSLVVGAASLWLLVAVPVGLSGHGIRGPLTSFTLGSVVHLAVALLPLWVGLNLAFYVGSVGSCAERVRPPAGGGSAGLCVVAHARGALDDRSHLRGARAGLASTSRRLTRTRTCGPR
jgi:ABC-type dipeptide/oligopeptide/nickel transport system permease component